MQFPTVEECDFDWQFLFDDSLRTGSQAELRACIDD
jgi:hypothetical protein